MRQIALVNKTTRAQFWDDVGEVQDNNKEQFITLQYILERSRSCHMILNSYIRVSNAYLTVKRVIATSDLQPRL